MNYLIHGETMIGPEATTHEFYITTEPAYSLSERDVATLLRELHPGTWVRAIRLTRVDDEGNPLDSIVNRTPSHLPLNHRHKAKRKQPDKHPTLF